MGTSFTYKCNKCDYQVLTSGQLDFGMIAVVDTFICKSCKAIVDVTVGEYGKVFTKKEVALKLIKSENDLDFYCCPDCGSEKKLVKWNNKIRPCPCCDGEMAEDSGDFILWD